MQPATQSLHHVGCHLEDETSRFATGSSELDRVLGGGLVAGSVILTGGDPGIGKSTLLLQTLCPWPAAAQSPLRHRRRIATASHTAGATPRFARKNLLLLADTQLERILKLAQKEKPRIIVIDSIQTMHTDLLPSAPGAVGQVRETAAQLVKFANRLAQLSFWLGHVTKEGTLADPAS